MNTTTTPQVTTAGFNGTAVYEPTVGLGTVLVSGMVTNAANIADIEIYDNGTDLGGIGGFQASNTGWTFQATLAPGKHFITASVTELSGAAYAIQAPFELVTGIQNQPYVYQELDQNPYTHVVTRVSNYDGTGTLVSQTAVAVNGGAASPLSVSIDPTASFEGATSAQITGTTSSYGSASSIEIFDGSAAATVDPHTGAIIPTAKALGFATLGTDGTWSFDAHVSAGNHVFTAVATGVTGLVASAQSSFAIDAGVVGSPYVYREIDHNALGGVAAVTSYATDGTVVSRTNDGGPTVSGGASTAEVIRSASDDVMTGDGTGSTTFLFRRGFGQDEITNFNYLNAAQSPAGIEHDVISLPKAVFANLAQVMRHTTMSLDGDAVIHLGKTDSIKLDGVTKADLITHPDVFRFHG